MTEEPSPPFWVFGYGSLMWNPEFPVETRMRADLRGYARRFCLDSVHHRGTPDSPGLVLALDPDPHAVCEGVAFLVPQLHAVDTLARLRERELVTDAYLERRVPLELSDGSRVEAITYVIDPDHEQYRADLTPEQQARIIARAVGRRGPNSEYLWNTVAHLDEMGIAEPDLWWLARRVREITLGHA